VIVGGVCYPITDSLSPGELRRIKRVCRLEIGEVRERIRAKDPDTICRCLSVTLRRYGLRKTPAQIAQMGRIVFTMEP
jgi:hypothetical protein